MKVRTWFIGLTAVMAVGLWSCAQPLDGSGDSAGLSIRIGGLTTQTILPDVDTQPSRYLLRGSGPGGSSFEVESTDGTATIGGLTAGDWSLEAEGRNEGGFPVARGQADVELGSGSTTVVTIAVTRVSGTGTLDIVTGWNADHTVSPSVQAQLTDGSGLQTDLQLDVTAPGEARLSATGVPTGYHTLSLRLLDSGEVVAGVSESVRVLADAATSAVLPFSDVNKVGAPIRITAAAFTLAWDPPTDSGSVDAYRIYARSRGTYEWRLVTEVEAGSEPKATVTDALLPYGTWELAVSAVGGGVETAKHTSMDDDADPATGWYVDWVGL